MAGFLANENVPKEVVTACRTANFDVAWVAETSPSADDNSILAAALSEKRVLLTFDKDFGDLAFHLGQNASCGVILFRPKLRSPTYLIKFVLSVLQQPIDWEGHYCVAREGKLRVVELPV